MLPVERKTRLVPDKTRIEGRVSHSKRVLRASRCLKICPESPSKSPLFKIPPKYNTDTGKDLALADIAPYRQN